MAENESLDLGGAYAKRWEVPFGSVQKGSSCVEVARKVEVALVRGLSKTLKQLNEHGVTLSDLLVQRGSRQALRQLIRKTQGHQYVQLFDAVVASSNSSAGDCLRGWLAAIFDKMSDQICLAVAGKDNWPTFHDIQEFMKDVWRTLQPSVERVATKLEKDPAWIPKLAPAKDHSPVNATSELLGMSLLVRLSHFHVASSKRRVRWSRNF